MTNDQIKALIREVIAEGIDLDIPDAEIARVTKAETAGLVRRVEALEDRLSPPEAEGKPTEKPARVDVLRARHAVTRSKENRAEARNA